MLRILFTSLLLVTFYDLSGWGFFAHKMINRHAVFSLPPEMVGFFKKHIHYLTENAVNPDRRRYAVKDEAPRHYIDIDHYGDGALYKMPRRWDQAREKYSEDTLKAYGIVPWHISLMKFRLTLAFEEKDLEAILRLAADLGHYVGDANVPLHTTENYNGQLTGQHGIHGFWESRLPELFLPEYDLLVGVSEYVESPQKLAWHAVTKAHQAVDSVLDFEREISEKFEEDKKFSFEERGSTFVRVYSQDYSKLYHRKLNGMVERQLKASIKMVADLWYTAWVDAGQPNLDDISENLNEAELDSLEKEKAKWLIRRFRSRNHESGGN